MYFSNICEDCTYSYSKDFKFMMYKYLKAVPKKVEKNFHQLFVYMVSNIFQI